MHYCGHYRSAVPDAPPPIIFSKCQIGFSTVPWPACSSPECSITGSRCSVLKCLDTLAKCSDRTLARLKQSNDLHVNRLRLCPRYMLVAQWGGVYQSLICWNVLQGEGCSRVGYVVLQGEGCSRVCYVVLQGECCSRVCYDLCCALGGGVQQSLLCCALGGGVQQSLL